MPIGNAKDMKKPTAPSEVALSESELDQARGGASLTSETGQQSDTGTPRDIVTGLASGKRTHKL